MIKIIATTLLTSLVAFTVLVNAPIQVFNIGEPELNLGTVGVSTISTATNLADFPATYNANLALLDNGKVDVSTTTIPSVTTLPGLTTASSLVSVGTITSGTWQGTAIDVARQGTGTTSPTLNQVILGNASSGFKVVNGLGASGQFLTSGGAGVAPTWTTSALNLADDFTWTGHHIFASAFHTAASSTNATTTNLTVTGKFSGAPTATTTVFTSSGTWVRPSNVDKVWVTVVGGGGGGGTGVEGGGTASGGGGAGGYCEAVVTVTGNVTVTVGAAGAADGGNGGNSSFAGSVTATANGGSGGADGVNGSIVAGGAGGSTSNCDVGITGGAGQGGDDLNTTSPTGGRGGSNTLGMGGWAGIQDANGDGGDVGTGYGAGGGGATSVNGSGATVGAAGTAGVVIVKWYE